MGPREYYNPAPNRNGCPPVPRQPIGAAAPPPNGALLYVGQHKFHSLTGKSLRQPCRCQPTTVSGVTKVRCSRRREHTRRASTRSSLSGCEAERVVGCELADSRRRPGGAGAGFSSTRSCRERAQASRAVRTSRKSSSTPPASPICAREVLPPDNAPGACPPYTAGHGRCVLSQPWLLDRSIPDRCSIEPRRTPRIDPVG